MYVTVATSPEALLTSHMGISRTWESAFLQAQQPPQLQKLPYVSLALHSFAAKVMKMRNPKKAYMLNAPAPEMREILIKKMPPHSIFVGDNETLGQLKKADQSDVGVQKLASQIQTNPPRIIINGHKLTIQSPSGKKLFTFDRRTSPIYQWLSLASYTGGGIGYPYVLTDLDKLAEASALISKSD